VNYKKKLSYFHKLFSRKSSQFKTIIALKEKIRLLEMSQDRAENYLKNIIRVIPANIYWKDLNCVLLGSNLSHAKAAGFSDPEEIIGKTEHDFVWKEQADEIMENSRLVMQSGVGCQLEEVATLADGKLHNFLTCKDPLRDKNNNVIGLIGVSTDITDFKELQQELLRTKMLAAESVARASRAKATAEEEMRKTIMMLVGDIVHDLRTPITTIKIVADLLETILPTFLEIVEEFKKLGVPKVNLLNQNCWDYLHNMTPITDIQNSIVMINDFINTTLTELANAHKALSSNLTKEELTKNSSRRIIDNTLKSYPFSDSERNKVKQNINGDFQFMGNSILLMKLLFNLIKNALEQIAINGNGDIFISTETGKDYNLIRIKDTAGGAPPEIVAHFFNGYFTTKENGTGIGLAFCKKVMTDFKGDIVCHSVYGESMEFILKFPSAKNL
jgi:PAS domain S-box-containing protein